MSNPAYNPAPPERSPSGAIPRLVICGAGAGELMTWVRPLVQALQQGGMRWDVALMLWPRVFLSGGEAAAARALSGISRVYPPAQALRLLAAGGDLLRGAGPALVLHLGGSARLSLRLGRRLGAPVLAYCERPQALLPGFAARYSTEPVVTLPGLIGLGNMLVDSVADLRARRSNPSGCNPIVGLLPGSRAVQLRHYLPRIGPVVESVVGRVPQARFMIARSPLISDAMLRQALRPSDPARLQWNAQQCVLRTAGGVCIPLLDREQVLTQARVLVCSPGTSTGEAAALGIPHLVVAPFDPSLPLFTGLPGLIERIPWPSRPLKRLLLRRLAGSVRYYAQANLRADREVVPELHGPLDNRQIAERLGDLLVDVAAQHRMAAELTEIMGPPGAASRLAQVLAQRITDL